MSDFIPKHPEGELEKLKAEFSEWRRNKTHQHERIPEKLLKESARLCQFYSISLIQKTLRIEYKKIRQFSPPSSSFLPKEEKKEKQGDFAVIPWQSSASSGSLSPLPSSYYEIEIENPNGIRVKLRSPVVPTVQILQNLKCLV